jgi:hypothetical protein
MWIEFGAEDPHFTSLTNVEWAEMRAVKRHNFRRGVYKILPLFFYILVQFG